MTWEAAEKPGGSALSVQLPRMRWNVSRDVDLVNQDGRLKAEELLAEEQARLRPGQSSVEQIFSSRVIIEKHIQYQCDLFRNFIDFKRAFDRVWHAGLWQVLRSFNIEEGLVQAIQTVYENSSSAALLNSQLGEFFKTT